MNIQSDSSMRDGIFFIIGLLAFQWKYCADIMNMLIDIDDSVVVCGIQIPIISSIDIITLVILTVIKVCGPSPNSLNSFWIFLYLNNHTNNTDSDIIIWDI